MPFSSTVQIESSKCYFNVLTEILTEEQKKEELEKLYSAIDYSEGEVITAFPKEVHVDYYLLEVTAAATFESCKEVSFKHKMC